LLAVFVVLTVLFASLAAAMYFGGGAARTTSTYYTSSTVIAGTTSLTAFPPGTLYDVTFKEGFGCGGYIDPWGVQLGNLTITQPPNIQLSQISENGYNASGKFGLTTITFSVPSGTFPSRSTRRASRARPTITPLSATFMARAVRAEPSQWRTPT
jgi:hypothetical protein